MRKRVGWARFLYSLMVRNPEVLVRLEQMAAEPTAEEANDDHLIRSETRPDAFDEFKEAYLAKPMNTSVQSLLPMLINSTAVIRAISDMRWSTCQLSDTRHSFLTSDRPIIMTNGLKDQGAHVAIPLSPLNGPITEAKT